MLTSTTYICVCKCANAWKLKMPLWWWSSRTYRYSNMIWWYFMYGFFLLRSPRVVALFWSIAVNGTSFLFARMSFGVSASFIFSFFLFYIINHGFVVIAHFFWHFNHIHLNESLSMLPMCLCSNIFTFAFIFIHLFHVNFTENCSYFVSSKFYFGFFSFYCCIFSKFNTHWSSEKIQRTIIDKVKAIRWWLPLTNKISSFSL